MQFSLQSSIYAAFEQSNILKQEDTLTENGVKGIKVVKNAFNLKYDFSVDKN